MTTKLNYTATVTIEDCCTCGGPIALSQEQRRALLNSHESYYCPMGHRQHFVGESDAERAKRLEKELEAHKGWLQRQKEFADHVTDQLQAERKSHATTKGQLTRTRKRAIAAVCPLCNRTFKQVAAHMKSKHPAAATPASEGAQQ